MLTVEDLTLAYGSKKVVEQVSFGVEAGEFVAILGPNGSGKSTLLKALCRLHSPLSGTITFGGRPLAAWRGTEIARQIAFVRQAAERAFDFIVQDLVMLGRLPYLGRFQRESAADYAVVEHYLRLTGLWPLKDRGIFSLSGGEMQRAFICLALVQEPQLLLLDEPTNHLDINHQLELLDLVAALNKQGTTVITVLHDLNLAALYAQRLLVLKEGRLVADGVPRDVLREDFLPQVYGCPVTVMTHPRLDKPQVLLVPADL